MGVGVAVGLGVAVGVGVTVGVGVAVGVGVGPPEGTLRFTNACSVRPLLLPVTVMPYVPTDTELLAEIVIVDEPDPPLMEDGLKLAVAPAGSPAAVSDTVDLKLRIGATVTVSLVLPPDETVAEAALVARLKIAGDLPNREDTSPLL